MYNRMFRIFALVAAAASQTVGCNGDDGSSSGSTSTDTGSTTTGSTTTNSSTDATGTTTTGPTTTDATTLATSTGSTDTSTSTADPSSTGGAVCGDANVDPGEDCDDGNADDTDACTSTCQAAVCGDGFVQQGVEACDDGNQSDDDLCLGTCVDAICGDGFIGPGEACDDGNQVDEDGCTNACALPSCGDGKVQQGEECDDGNAESADACLNTCLNAICGDNTIQVGVEACDDANGIDTDECPGTCQAASCGDGFVQDGVDICDDGNMSDGDECTNTCQAASCGDGFVQAGVEVCDDGNMIAQDGCEADCTESVGAAAVVSGWYHTCALTTEGAVRCWGRNTYGSLGQGNVVQIGDDELPSVLPPVDLGTKALALVAGEFHTCALVENGKVRCWGRSNFGQLGLASVNSIGDNEQPWSVSDVPIGGTVQALAAGRNHTCALLGGGKVRCWGAGAGGALGYGNVNNIGDNETPASAGDVMVGGVVKQIAAGESFTCALLDDDTIRCWGLGTNGALGQGNVVNIGDDELPSSVGSVPLGVKAKSIAAGRRHTCAISTGDTLHCWGLGSNGQLGYGTTASVGDNETPSVVGFVSLLGAIPVSMALNYASTCILLDSDEVRCWGNSTYGQLGQANVVQIGDTEAPSTIPVLDIGVTATQLSANWYQTCVRGADYSVRCWGRSEFGQLGYGTINNIGDDELPAAAGPVMFMP